MIIKVWGSIIIIIFCLSSFFKGCTLSIQKFPGQGSNRRCCCWPLPERATATPDPSHICDLHHSSQQYQFLNSLSKARDWIYILMDTGQILNPLSHIGNSTISFFQLCPRHVEVPRPRIKPTHNSDLSHSSDTTGSLTRCASRELLCTLF